jgi:undecaprenyl-diphosphatase
MASNVPTVDRVPAPAGSARRRLAGLLTVAGAGVLFATLLVLIRYQWAPLESVDHGLAARSNSLVSQHPVPLSVARAVTRLGSNGVLWWLIGIALLVLLLRRLYRLAAYLVVTGAGALILDPTLKLAVGRLRPVVADPVAHGTGNSFPSGHALGSIVCYGALLLVFLPAVRHRWRPRLAAAVAVLVAAVGVSRILLGVHYLSDVVGAWALGVAWLGLTAFAFEMSRWYSGQRVTQPLAEGLTPDSAGDLKPADPAAAPVSRRPRTGWSIAATVVGWVMVFGALVGLGELITRYGGANLLGDTTIPHWFAAHRNATGDRLSLYLSRAGDTHAITLVGVLAGTIAIALLRRWRPVVFLVSVMFGELTLFLATAAIIGRPRPDVRQLDTHLPTSSFPSGHVAATICLYGAIALLVIMPGGVRSAWRWLALVPLVAMPVLVATSRMYRGMHHPTDVLASLVLATVWLAITWYTVRPYRAASLVATGSAAARSAAPDPAGPDPAAPDPAAPDPAASDPAASHPGGADPAAEPAVTGRGWAGADRSGVTPPGTVPPGASRSSSAQTRPSRATPTTTAMVSWKAARAVVAPGGPAAARWP